MTDQATERAERDYLVAGVTTGTAREDVGFRPFKDRVLVRPHHQAEEKTETGLYIPPQAQTELQIGEVLAIGPGRVTDQGVRVPMEVEVGQIVMYGKYAGTEITLDGEELLVFQEGDLYGEVEDAGGA